MKEMVCQADNLVKDKASWPRDCFSQFHMQTPFLFLPPCTTFKSNVPCSKLPKSPETLIQNKRRSKKNPEYIKGAPLPSRSRTTPWDLSSSSNNSPNQKSSPRNWRIRCIHGEKISRKKSLPLSVTLQQSRRQAASDFSNEWARKQVQGPARPFFIPESTTLGVRDFNAFFPELFEEEPISKSMTRVLCLLPKRLGDWDKNPSRVSLESCKLLYKRWRCRKCCIEELEKSLNLRNWKLIF